MTVRILCLALMGIALAACGGKGDQAGSSADSQSWDSSPDRVVQGIMHAYATRDDSLYASLLADEYRYRFQPPGENSDDALGWGREEDIVSTGNLFRTPEVRALTFDLKVEPARPVEGSPELMMVPVSGGELRVEVADKEPMQQMLNRQEIYLRRDSADPERWRIVEWKDFPAP